MSRRVYAILIRNFFLRIFFFIFTITFHPFLGIKTTRTYVYIQFRIVTSRNVRFFNKSSSDSSLKPYCFLTVFSQHLWIIIVRGSFLIKSFCLAENIKKKNVIILGHFWNFFQAIKIRTLMIRAARWASEFTIITYFFPLTRYSDDWFRL